MNMHLSPQDPAIRAQLEHDAVGLPDERRRRRRRALLWTALALAAVGLFVWWLVARATAPKPSAPPAGPPAVSVMVPGTAPVTEVVTALGTIAARRDMPVGVVGEGGMVTSIRAEAGQYVGRGQVLAELDSAVQRAQLAQLEAGVAQAEADARLAQAELDRAQALVERGFISRADIDRRTATRDAARARVGVARAQVREMQERLARLAIRAPEAGLVLERRVEPGQVVSPGSGALFRIAAGGRMEVRAVVAEQDLARLAVGQVADVAPVGSASRHAGTVWLLEPVVDPSSRQGTARIALPPAPDLRAGDADIGKAAGARANRPLVPQSAVLTDAGGAHVLVVGAGDVVERRPVRLGDITPAGVAVLDGLSGRERVVVSAGAFLRPGEKVAPVLARTAAAPAPAPAPAPAQG